MLHRIPLLQLYAPPALPPRRYLQTVVDKLQLNMQTAVREKETLHGMLGLHPEVNGITECRLCPNADCFIQCVAAAAAARA